MNLNKVQIAGRLGRDPDIKTTPNGTVIGRLNVATNNVYKDKTGEKKQTTTWHTIIFFGKVAETIAKYFQKGQEIYVEGRIETRSWEKDGQKHYMTEIIGDTFQFVGSKGKDTQTASQSVYTSPQEVAPPPIDTSDIKIEDIPF